MNALKEAVLAPSLLEVTVVGVPAPQGSKKAFVRGKKAILVESSAKVAPWRTAVALAAVEAAGRDWQTIDGPVLLEAAFTLPRPKSAPKTLRRVPDRTPDLSKLLRSTEDALATDSNILSDDARIVAFLWPRKVYEGDPLDPDALRHPGAVLRLWAYPDHLLGKNAPA